MEIGLKVEVEVIMKLKDRPGVRLRTKNFRPVKKAGGILNIDFDEKSKTAEIEWISNDIYHYLDVTKKEWAEIIEYVNKGEGKGLTTHVNQEFKDKHGYYKLIVLSEPIFE